MPLCFLRCTHPLCFLRCTHPRNTFLRCTHLLCFLRCTHPRNTFLQCTHPRNTFLRCTHSCYTFFAMHTSTVLLAMHTSTWHSSSLGNSVIRVGLSSLLEFQLEGQLARVSIAIDLALCIPACRNLSIRSENCLYATTKDQTQDLRSSAIFRGGLLQGFDTNETLLKRVVREMPFMCFVQYIYPCNKMLYRHRINMVLADPNYNACCCCTGMGSKCGPSV